MVSNDKIKAVGVNIREKANLIWNVANTLFGAYKPHEYGLVILPMAVIKRFHDCLLPTQEKVVETYEKVKGLAVKDGFLRSSSGYRFYNTSSYNFDRLKADPENIKTNFETYINGFSDNIIDILANMGFYTQIERMADAGVLYQVICDFCKESADMSPEKISAVDMGYVFENLVQRFSESYDEEAGAHFTSRDIIYLMCDLLTTDADFSGEDSPAKTVYDMAMGTSQMLTCMEERIRALDSEAEIICYGQEFNPFTFGIAKADMLIRGGDPDNMQFGNTLNDDKFSNYTFDYCISNPPFGIDWKREASDIEREHKLGDKGRFGVGLPPKSDGQMLFMLNGLAKLKDTGKMAIIQNGSSLFTGDAGSGPSEIRRYLIENDWLDAIVQLPNDSFYNTGITTYVWIISKDKSEGHREQVLLIDASKCFEQRRTPIGNKRIDITDPCRELIVQAYGNYYDGVLEKKLDNGKTIICKSKTISSVKLGYNKVTVESPQLDDNGKPVKKKGAFVADTSKRDTESIPLDEDIDDFFAREVLPYREGAWIDKSKTKVGYEIPFTRTFYEYKELEPAADIAKRIKVREESLLRTLGELFKKEDE
jgi:type I restriction enzyme M protein